MFSKPKRKTFSFLLFHKSYNKHKTRIKVKFLALYSFSISFIWIKSKVFHYIYSKQFCWNVKIAEKYFLQRVQHSLSCVYRKSVFWNLILHVLVYFSVNLHTKYFLNIQKKVQDSWAKTQIGIFCSFLIILLYVCKEVSNFRRLCVS